MQKKKDVRDLDTNRVPEWTKLDKILAVHLQYLNHKSPTDTCQHTGFEEKHEK